MKKNIKLLLATLLVTFSLFVFILSMFLDFNLSEIGNIFNIASSLSIVIALSGYFYQKRQDELSATIDQITFFREKVISEMYVVQNKIKKMKSDFIPSRIAPSIPTIKVARKEFKTNFTRQLDIIFEISKNNELTLGGEILDSQIFLLNMLEEFSLKVTLLKTSEHPALEGIQNTFIEIIEKNAVALLFMREIITGQPLYSTNLFLYKLWKKENIKNDVIKNLITHGLVTEDQGIQAINKRRTTLGY